MSTPLVDADGFPRADIDIYAVRGARVRIIELRNDLARLTDEIGRALEGVYAPGMRASTTATGASEEGDEAGGEERGVPFAKVNGVLSGSPAAEAGLQMGDLVTRFGHLTHQAFASGLAPLAEFVAANENRIVTIQILREEESKTLNFTPRKGWGGRGLLGCHLVPHTA
jgi:26S proteasome non-ATPase regulatory subunit 9